LHASADRQSKSVPHSEQRPRRVIISRKCFKEKKEEEIEGREVEDEDEERRKEGEVTRRRAELSIGGIEAIIDIFAFDTATRRDGTMLGRGTCQAAGVVALEEGMKSERRRRMRIGKEGDVKDDEEGSKTGKQKGRKRKGEGETS